MHRIHRCHSKFLPRINALSVPYLSSNLEVASSRWCWMPGSCVLCPAPVTRMYSASGHLRCSSQEVTMGQTTSYLPCTMTHGMWRILSTLSSNCDSGLKKPPLQK